MLVGKPVIRGTRLAVEFILGLMAEGWPEPYALGAREMENIKQACVASVKRAARIGLDFVEVHSTHGYLFSEFLSLMSAPYG